MTTVHWPGALRRIEICASRVKSQEQNRPFIVRLLDNHRRQGQSPRQPLLRAARPSQMRRANYGQAAAPRPKLAVPQHYAFTGGPVGDLHFTKSDKDPAHFVEAARRLVPDVPVKAISPGEPLTVTR
jgi:hypothetical protein